MSKTIADARESIDRFIFEAEECAKQRKEFSTQRLGFAAMSTIFSVILSISEAVGTLDGTLVDKDDKNLLKNFISRMTDKTTWLVSRELGATLSDDNIAAELLQVRNGLAHQLSLPDYMGLINIKSDAKEFMKEHPAIKRAICVVEFIEAVKTTVDGLAKNYPSAVLDPSSQRVRRTVAKQVIMPSGTSSSPASSEN